jgi:hypothetical protein
MLNLELWYIIFLSTVLLLKLIIILVHSVNEYASRQQIIVMLKFEAVFSSTFAYANLISEQSARTHVADDP